MGLLGAIPGAISQGLIWGIMAVGVYITYKIMDIADLTVDGSICTGAVVCTMLVINGFNVWFAMLCALIAGMITGIITGFFHAAFGIPPILSGILTQLILWSVNLKIMGKANQSISARNYKVIIAQMNVTKSVFVLIAFIVVMIAVLYWFFGTELGCSLRATGCNAYMSRAQGINTSKNNIIGLALSNGIVALAGALLCQYQGYTDINMGRGAIVIGLAAVIIGEAVAAKISTNFAVRLSGVVIGGVIYYIIYQIVVYIGFDTDLLKMFSALVVAVFLGFPHLKTKFAGKFKRKCVDVNVDSTDGK